MRNERLALAAVAFTFAVAASACDAQTTPDYPGSNLLTIHGTIAGDVPDTEIVPALAFTDENLVTQTTYLVDLDVEGEFPTRFAAHVYDAPPAGALYSPPAVFGPAGASAAIVAVRAGHPASIVDRFRSESESCGGATCVREKTVYGDDGQTVLYFERTVCDANWANCQTTTTGDASAGVTLADVLYGIVSNYRLIYLAKDVSKSTPTVAAAAYGPMSAGYHLVSQRDATEAEIAEMQRCEGDATAQALADFNAQHGTSYTAPDQVPAGDPALAELQQRAWNAFVQRGCRLNTGVISTPVVADRDNPVTMQISNDSSLLDRSYL